MRLQGIGGAVSRAVRAWFAPPSSPAIAPLPAPDIPTYFTEPSWNRRCEAFLASLPQSMGGGFAAANAEIIRGHSLASRHRTRMHVVFNLGAGALLNYLQTGLYKNAYQLPLVNGKRRKPSATRVRVDNLIGLPDPTNAYFCALEMGGAGIRFYGEYCAVLKSPEDERRVNRVMDRNSYDLICPPIKLFLDDLDLVGQRRLIDGLSAKFRSPDSADMLAIKVMQTENAHARLLTAATIGAAVIRDEDYVEAYHEGPIALATVHELRESSEDKMSESNIGTRWLGAQKVSVEEMLWLQRREAVRSAAAATGIPIRTVSGSGRTQRWK
jgi:hypothetical protein